MKLHLLLFTIILILAACAPSPLATPSPAPLASRGGIEILEATVRLPGNAGAGVKDTAATLAGYFVIKNTGPADDSLLSIQADFAGLTMLHESFVDSNGVAGMNMVSAVAIPAGQTVELKPGGFHAMFVGLKRELKVGSEVTLTLQFQTAGRIDVQARVTAQ